MTLNENQKKAALHKDGAMLVLAGPGSGKTAVITARTVHLITHYKITPSSILVVTFTRAAANEMKERFLHTIKQEHTEVTFGTFHGVFFGILRQAYGIGSQNILSEAEKADILHGLILNTDLEIEDEGDFISSLNREISLVKTNQIVLNHYYSASCPDELFRELYQQYHHTLQSRRKIDFDDMMVYCYELFSQRPDILRKWQGKYRYILIDEFQDINQIQYEIIKMLAKPEDNLFVVGDDDQSIYRFRGARPEIMLHFPKDYKKTQKIVLNQNYRCSGEILKSAQQMIQKNKSRYEKQLTAVCQPGDKVEIQGFETGQEEALYLLTKVQEYQKQGYSPDDMAILFRTNTGSRTTVNCLLEYQIPFILRDTLPNLYEHWIAKNITAYMRMAAGSRERKDFLMIMNRPNRYISREALYEKNISFESLYQFYEDKSWMCDRLEELEKNLQEMARMTPYAAINYIRYGMGYHTYIKEYASFRKINQEELYEILNEIQESAKPFHTFQQWFDYINDYKENLIQQAKEPSQRKGGITISTLHSAKGLEYKKVFIPDINEGMIPYQKAVLDENLEEERRLFYVGMTRAKENLHLYYIKKRFDKPLKPSRFLTELTGDSTI